MALSEKYAFRSALPVWEQGKENEMNYSLIFRAKVTKGEKELHITSRSKYQIFVNGSFFAEGPARAGHGFFRVSEYPLSEVLTKEVNCVCIIAAGYNVNSFYLTEGSSFLCAEIVGENGVEYATGTEKEFEAVFYSERVRKVQRYSFQRPFIESYFFCTTSDAFLTDPDYAPGSVKLAAVPAGEFIERRVPCCRYREITARKIASFGLCSHRTPEKMFDDRSLKGISDKLKGYPEDKLMQSVVNEVYALRFSQGGTPAGSFRPFELMRGSYAVCDMGVNTTGFIKIDIKAEEDMVLYAVFNEKLPADGIPDPGRNSCANVVTWALEGGRNYELVSFEPYTYKFIQLIALHGACTVTNVAQLRETYDETLTVNKKSMPTPELQKIYDAAYETFVQNTTDIFMDCPSRERAGWLCDSFFTSRTEKALTGQSLVENNFLENFIQPEKFDHIPEGMLPMCYPSDHNDGTYIPNWSMWYVLELREYLERSGDRALVDAAKNRLFKLAAFFEKYENADGLLAKLDSWVFVEWSEANDYVQDVNYPTNMLYAAFLDALAQMYGEASFAAKAENIRNTIRTKAFNGKFFIDNAVYDENGTAVNTANPTETCQYYAFFTKTATKEAYPELWETLLNDFGPVRAKEDKYPDVPRSNAFIGNYLRLELLFNDKRYEKLTEEITSFFLPMAETTGTLWENMDGNASCNHGFASHVIYWLNNIFG